MFSCVSLNSRLSRQQFGNASVKHQVTAYWQWLRYCESRPRAGKRLLLISLDETSVSFAPDTGKGLVVIRSARTAKAFDKKQDARTTVTYVALVCDGDSMQERMPHFIITSKAKATLAQMHALHASFQSNVHIWRGEKSSWNNSKLMQRILVLIHKAVANKHDVQPVLILDVAPCHITQQVMQKARSLGVWLVYVPGQVTFLNQPLDTHCFSSFKTWLRRRYEELRSTSADCVVNRLQWLRTLQKAKESFFDQRSWTGAFQDTGARLPCSSLTKDLLAHTKPNVARCAAALEPDAKLLELFWPRRRRMDYAHAALFRTPVARMSGISSDNHAAAAKRPLPASHVSIALSSRSNKQACRQYPARPADDQI